MSDIPIQPVEAALINMAKVCGFIMPPPERARLPADVVDLLHTLHSDQLIYQRFWTNELKRGVRSDVCLRHARRYRGKAEDVRNALHGAAMFEEAAELTKHAVDADMDLNRAIWLRAQEQN